MNVVEVDKFSPQFLLSKIFDNFYLELIKAKKTIASAGTDYSQGLIEKIHTNIKDLIIKETIAFSNSINDITDPELKDALYTITSLADETFLRLDWLGRQYWENNLLEFEFFSTHVAGEKIFTKIDELLKNKNTFQTDIALVYFKTLSCGFQGKYFSNEPKEIKEYKKRLYQFLTQSIPSFSSNQYLCPENYNYITKIDVRKKLPDPKWLGYSLTLLGFLLIGMSAFIWSELITPINKEIKTIEKLAEVKP